MSKCLLCVGALTLCGGSAWGQSDAAKVAKLVADLTDQDSSAETKREAAYGLGELKQRAESALPHLAREFRTATPRVRREIAQAYGRIGKAAVPALTEAARTVLTDQNTYRPGDRPFVERLDTQRAVMESLAGIGPDARPAAAVVREQLALVPGSNGKHLSRTSPLCYLCMKAVAKIDAPDQAAATLGRLLANPPPADGSSWWVNRASLAAELLGDLGPAAKPAVPTLTRFAQSGAPEHGSSLSLQRNSIQSLGRIGPAAAEALPVLRAVLADRRARDLHSDAEKAIKSIRTASPADKGPGH